MSIGLVAVGLVGGAVLLVVLCDVFVTIFNYDGFSFLSERVHRVLWSGLRRLALVLPARGGAALLRYGSAALLPATLVVWLILELSAFALVYLPGLANGSFRLADHLHAQIGTAFYLSAGDISSLTFGDIVARTGLYQALVDLETLIGLATVGLTVTYILAALDALASLNRLHARVRRQATEPNRPATVIARYFDGGHPDELSTLLQALADDLESYDQGLRRYPVVFYFHTLRIERSIRHIFTALGTLIELIRWGLPDEERLTRHPYLLAVADEYLAVIARLQRSFVGPRHDPDATPLPEDAFWDQYRSTEPASQHVRVFRALQNEASQAAGLHEDRGTPAARTYDRYLAWLQFHCRRHAIIDRVSKALGYGPHGAEFGSLTQRDTVNA